MQKYPCKQLLHDRGICVVIPTYNNAGTLADVVRRTKEQCDDVIVVNDGSTDDTRLILQSIPGIIVVDYARNEGKGTALKRGFQKALAMGFAYAITLDSDGQHYPEDIPLLVEAHRQHPGCLIVGQRRLEGVQRSKGSKFANAFSNFWFCVQTFHRLRDTQTGYRLYPLRKLHGLSLLTSRYEAELELLVFASWHGVKIVSVGINVFYPPMEERVSHFRPGPDFARISVLNTVLCVLALVYGLPCALFRLLRTVLITFGALLVYLVGAFLLLLPTVAVSKLLRLGSSPIHACLHGIGRFVTAGLNLLCGGATIENPHGEDFARPAILVCNHQSHLDLMLHLGLTRKIVFITNDWVWRSPFFGHAIRSAEYLRASAGVEELIPQLKALAERGFIISIFPEGTRSADCAIGRFHKGAFHLAQALDLDVLPVTLYGAGKVLPKGCWSMRRWKVCLRIEERITPAQLRAMGDTELEQCKAVRRLFQQRYATMCNAVEQYV
ncbi:MAG: glycosyltransferase [Bacteroidaceae bacterium]|nr:glycosyltransferase [Bacteroidaceae bacterium]